jgi:flagellar biosynthesis protein FlhA
MSLTERLQGAKSAPLMFVLLSVIALMVLPLPPVLLDLLLSVNITVAVLILLTAVFVNRPLEFSVLPALLLISTLFRLGLNVASTRLILLGAAEGKANAGRIIETFGHFVVGGNSIIGIIVFLILVLINFMVITKGAGRIAEVAARFTLDALPGKQMAIDAELAAGTLTEEDARQKRSDVERESDFYGAMDGASKFVRGDAIAGLIITAINIMGGLLIAVFQGGMAFGDAAQTYTVLTVGDGLVSQIPALLISTATGVVVTRAASAAELGDELTGQLLGDQRVLFGASVTLFLLGLVPGMPFMIFATMAGAIGWLGWRVSQAADETVELDDADEKKDEKAEPELDELLRVETLALEIGFGLVKVVDEASGGSLLKRLVQVRRQYASDLGIIVPSIHIRDNLQMAPGAYRLLLKGVPIASAELRQNKLMAINPGFVTQRIDGEPTKDPTFGLDAVWVDESQRHRAEAAGYTVVDHEAVITTHVTEVIRQHAAELFGWEDLEDRLEEIKLQAPRLVEELVGERLSFGKLLNVLRRLLSEGVSIRDLRSVLEALAESAHPDTSVNALTDQVRARLARQISAQLTDENGTLHAALLDRPLEDKLRQCLVKQQGEPVLACDLVTAQGLFGAIEEALGKFAVKDAEPVILAPPDLRGPLEQFLAQFFPDIQVLCHREVVPSAELVSVAQLSLPAGELEGAQQAQIQ